jgi:hypothetical protein
VPTFISLLAQSLCHPFSKAQKLNYKFKLPLDQKFIEINHKFNRNFKSYIIVEEI